MRYSLWAFEYEPPETVQAHLGELHCLDSNPYLATILSSLVPAERLLHSISSVYSRLEEERGGDVDSSWGVSFPC